MQRVCDLEARARTVRHRSQKMVEDFNSFATALGNRHNRIKNEAGYSRYNQKEKNARSHKPCSGFWKW